MACLRRIVVMVSMLIPLRIPVPYFSFKKGGLKRPPYSDHALLLGAQTGGDIDCTVINTPQVGFGHGMC